MHEREGAVERASQRVKDGGVKEWNGRRREQEAERKWRGRRDRGEREGRGRVHIVRRTKLHTRPHESGALRVV